MNKTKICFMGTPEFALKSLEKINEQFCINVVISAPDKKRHRGKFSPTPIKKRALELGIDVLTPENINDEESIKAIKAYEFEYIVVVAYGQFIGEEIRNLTKNKIINLHPSLLPKYRGAAPLFWPILNGDEKTGISIMMVEEGMDTGDILLMEEYLLGQMDAKEHHDKMAIEGANALVKVLNNYDFYFENRKPQEGEVTYAKKITREMGHLNFNSKFKEIERKIRGLNPWPGTYFFIEGKRFRIFDIEKINNKKGSPGVLFEKKGEIFIHSVDSLLKINGWQEEGKKLMKVEDYLRGNPMDFPIEIE